MKVGNLIEIWHCKMMGKDAESLKKYADAIFRWRTEKNIFADFGIRIDTSYHYFEEITFKQFKKLKNKIGGPNYERFYYYENTSKRYSFTYIWSGVFK